MGDRPGYCHTARPGSRGFSTKQPGGYMRTGAEVVLVCRMFYRGSHRAAAVAYVLLISGSSKPPVGHTSPYASMPRLLDCSRKYGLKLRIGDNWIHVSRESIENCHSPRGISQKGHAIHSRLPLGPCVICMRTRDAMRVHDIVLQRPLDLAVDLGCFATGMQMYAYLGGPTWGWHCVLYLLCVGTNTADDPMPRNRRLGHQNSMVRTDQLTLR